MKQLMISAAWLVILAWSNSASGASRPRLGILAEKTRGGFVRVVEVADASPAAEAGLEAGDLIILVDGKESAQNWPPFLRPDTAVLLRVSRGKNTFEVKITPRVPQDAWLAALKAQYRKQRYSIRHKVKKDTLILPYQGQSGWVQRTGTVTTVNPGTPGGVVTAPVEWEEWHLFKGEVPLAANDYLLLYRDAETEIITWDSVSRERITRDACEKQGPREHGGCACMRITRGAGFAALGVGVALSAAAVGLGMTGELKKEGGGLTDRGTVALSLGGIGVPVLLAGLIFSINGTGKSIDESCIARLANDHHALEKAYLVLNGASVTPIPKEKLRRFAELVNAANLRLRQRLDLDLGDVNEVEQ